MHNNLKKIIENDNFIDLIKKYFLFFEVITLV